MVLPVPGGPASNAPLGTLAPIFLYFAGSLRKSTSSLISILALPSPAISLNLTSGRYPSICPSTLDLKTLPMLELKRSMGKMSGSTTLLTALKNLMNS